MRERRRDYELMFIISPLHANDESINAVIERVKGSIEAAGGTVSDVNHSAPWGRRKLAYPIRAYAGGEASRRGFTEGYYVLLHFSLASTQVGEVERTLKLTDAVLRHLVTVVEKKANLTLSSDVEDTSADEDLEDEDLEDEDELIEESDD